MKGIVSEITKKGILVIIEDGNFGLIPGDKVKEFEVFKIGQLIEVMVSGNDEKGKITLSLNTKEKEGFEDKMQRFLKESTREYLDFQKRKLKKKR